ncbi:DUF3703 domain-containing protein [Leptospira stimsonii]|uniref:Uncharacterized protein n=1 Tax=Leptospira stimsonii TaxID=2202203 RepID=A0A396YSG9_9LEPT|nr:hypothetical protein DLM75_22740 [Leptospira stimsonii]
MNFRMPLFEVRTGKRKEFFGQLLRFAVGGFRSLFDRVSVGNSGGVNVLIPRDLPLLEDLRGLLKTREFPHSLGKQNSSVKPTKSRNSHFSRKCPPSKKAIS